MSNEIQILEYKLLYGQLQKLPGSHYTVRQSLKNHIEALRPYLLKFQSNNKIDQSRYKTLVKGIDSFVEGTFPQSISNIYKNTPTSFSKTPNSQVQGIDFLNAVKIIQRGYPETLVDECKHKLNFLEKILQCWQDTGLHNEIEKRDPDKWMRYNILIEHNINKKNIISECLHLISLEKLKRSFIDPFHAQQTILINGAKIPNNNLVRLKITSTLLTDDEIVNFKSKRSIRSWEAFAKACLDETNRLLDSPSPVRDGGQDENVPFILHLMHNLNTSEVVIDAFYSLVPQPKDRPENYTGRLHWYNAPFSVNVCGAYPLMTDWEFLKAKIKNGYYDQYLITKNDIEDYLKKYGEGFVLAYHSFEKDNIEKRSSLFNEISDKEQIVFDWATGSLFKGSGFPETFGGKRHLFSEWFNAGKEAGYFYRAWYIMLQNSKRFESFFKKVNDIAPDNFLIQFIKGIAQLQNHDVAEPFIKLLKEGTAKDEGSFRNWFRTYFSGPYDHVLAEPLKGNGRIDLKIVDEKIGTKIIEFKGWWNKDVFNIAEQITGYLTDFEDTGYIFMVNDLKRKDITDSYRELITRTETYYEKDSWQELKYSNSGFCYYCSDHRFGNKIKRIYHFIYRLYP